jgi:hypothetical protein
MRLRVAAGDGFAAVRIRAGLRHPPEADRSRQRWTGPPEADRSVKIMAGRRQRWNGKVAVHIRVFWVYFVWQFRVFRITEVFRIRTYADADSYLHGEDGLYH